jgi:hypothetical protein
MLMLLPLIGRRNRHHPPADDRATAEAAMSTGSRPRCSLLIVTVTIVAMIIATLTTPVSAETTHEANQAAAELTAAPSTLTAAVVLAQITDPDGMLRFEIAEDGTRFVWADQSLFTDRHAVYGAPFLAQGYMYPPGTLAATSGGVNADGSPQFPEKVVGAWTCYGWYLGGGAQATNGPWILATEIYQFGSEWGAVTLVSDGYVATDSGRTVDRAITGGTGPFATMRGEVQSTPLGINETQGSNARYEVRLGSQ